MTGYPAMAKPAGFDWQRLLIGSAPWSFLAEVLLRIAGIYLVLVLVVRLFGKRMGGQLGNLELAVLLALGAIVSVPFQDPGSGVLSGVVLLTSLLALQRGLSALGARSPRVETMTQNHATALVADGTLVLEQLKKASISTAQLFAVLRGQGVRQLGQIKRVYLEAHGGFSTLRREPALPGLSIAADWDADVDADGKPFADVAACRRCGTTRTGAADAASAPCSRCGGHAWTRALGGD
jgi:hypothetical protein